MSLLHNCYMKMSKATCLFWTRIVKNQNHKRKKKLSIPVANINAQIMATIHFRLYNP